jgi:hypothetical protein
MWRIGSTARILHVTSVGFVPFYSVIQAKNPNFRRAVLEHFDTHLNSVAIRPLGSPCGSNNPETRHRTPPILRRVSWRNVFRGRSFDGNTAVEPFQARNTASGRPEVFDPVCEFAMDDPR